MNNTIVAHAVKGTITEEMRKIAATEGLSAEQVRECIAEGRIVVPMNSNRACRLTVSAWGCPPR